MHAGGRGGACIDSYLQMGRRHGDDRGAGVMGMGESDGDGWRRWGWVGAMGMVRRAFRTVTRMWFWWSFSHNTLSTFSTPHAHAAFTRVHARTPRSHALCVLCRTRASTCRCARGTEQRACSGAGLHPRARARILVSTHVHAGGLLHSWGGQAVHAAQLGRAGRACFSCLHAMHACMHVCARVRVLR